MRHYISIFFFLLGITNHAQVKDSNFLQNQKKKQVLAITGWEEQIISAKKRGDVYSEMMILPELFKHKIRDFGDNTGAYKDIMCLKKLIEANPNSPAIKQVLPDFNMTMGMLLRDQYRYDESLVYFLEAVWLAKRDSIFDIYRDTSNHVGEILSLQGKNKDALDQFSKIELEGLPFEGDNKEYLARIYQFKAEHFFRNNQMDSTLYYAKKSLYDLAPLNMKSDRYALIADVYLNVYKEIDSVIYYANKSLDAALDMGAEREEITAHNILRKAYQKNGNFKEANYHFEKFYGLQQKQRSFRNALLIGNLNLQNEREEASLQQVLALERFSNQRLMIWIASIASLLLTVGFFYINNRLKIINKQNKIIELEKLRAEQSEKYKEQFLSNMSHEIRTPMHAISGMLNSLRRQPHPNSQNDFLDAMKISADNLLVLLNDVLDMSKIESGNLEIVKINMNAIEIVQQVVNIYHNKAEEKGLELKMNIAEDFPKTIIGDPGRLNQILMNLVSNAIKFTENGYVEINLSHSQDNIKFVIKDTGIGISSSQKETVFESFKQGDNISKGFYGGTGLGLTITKQLIELQEGNICVLNEEDEGSVFYFELPLIVSEQTEEIQTFLDESHLKVIGNELKGLRVLVAEDNEFNTMVIKDDLSWYIPDVKITFVENGKLAVETYNNFDFDIILMDVQMPELNGYEATKRIREIENKNKITRPIPIVAMTASLLKNQIDKCYDAGMAAYIPKPYKPEDLINTIKSVTQ